MFHLFFQKRGQQQKRKKRKSITGRNAIAGKGNDKVLYERKVSIGNYTGTQAHTLTRTTNNTHTHTHTYKGHVNEQNNKYNKTDNTVGGWDATHSIWKESGSLQKYVRLTANTDTKSKERTHGKRQNLKKILIVVIHFFKKKKNDFLPF